MRKLNTYLICCLQSCDFGFLSVGKAELEVGSFENVVNSGLSLHYQAL